MAEEAAAEPIPQEEPLPTPPPGTGSLQGDVIGATQKRASSIGLGGKSPSTPLGPAARPPRPVAGTAPLNPNGPGGRSGQTQRLQPQDGQGVPGIPAVTPVAPAPEVKPAFKPSHGTDVFVRSKILGAEDEVSTEEEEATTESDDEKRARIEEEAKQRALFVARKRWDAMIKLAEEILAQGETVVKPLESKMMAIKIALDLAKRPRADAEIRMAQLPGELHGLIRGIMTRAQSTPELAKQLQVAVFQFGDAMRATSALKERHARARELETEDLIEAVTFLSAVELPKVRGKLYVLTNFPIVFQRDPIISRLFPARAKPGTAKPEDGLPKTPGAPTAPLTGQGAPTQPTTSAPTGPTESSDSKDRADLWKQMREQINRFRPNK